MWWIEAELDWTLDWKAQSKQDLPLVSGESWEGSKESKKRKPSSIYKSKKGTKDSKIEGLKRVHKWAINVTYLLFWILNWGSW